MNKTGTITLALTALLFAPVAALAAEPADVKKYRASVMTSLRGHVGAAAMIVRGLIEDEGQLAAHAAGLAAGAKEIARLFPEGSAVDDSKALPAIWEDADGFAEAIQEYVEASEAFASAAEGADRTTIVASFRRLGGACRGCHDNFRQSD